METTINYNGTEIILNGEYVGTARPWGDYTKQQHEVEVCINGKTVTFDFYCNDCDLDDKELAEAFYFFLSDGIAYNNAEDIDDFAAEFGYDKPSQLIKAYDGCKDAYDKWCSLTDIDIYEIANWLQDKYNF